MVPRWVVLWSVPWWTNLLGISETFVRATVAQPPSWILIWSWCVLNRFTWKILQMVSLTNLNFLDHKKPFLIKGKGCRTGVLYGMRETDENQSLLIGVIGKTHRFQDNRLFLMELANFNWDYLEIYRIALKRCGYGSDGKKTQCHVDLGFASAWQLSTSARPSHLHLDRKITIPLY